MSMPQGAVRYRCPCGAEYLVALRGTADETWLETIGAVARKLGLGIVDGSDESFVCHACGVSHLRADVRAEHDRVEQE